MGKKFLKTYLQYCTREVGPNFTRSMWQKFNMRWSDFMEESEIADFIETNVRYINIYINIYKTIIIITICTFLEIRICGKRIEDASD